MPNCDSKGYLPSCSTRAGRVDYLVVGGYALAANAHPRYTGDIDFWVSPAAENNTRLLKALKAFGLGSPGLPPLTLPTTQPSSWA